MTSGDSDKDLTFLLNAAQVSNGTKSRWNDYFDLLSTGSLGRTEGSQKTLAHLLMLLVEDAHETFDGELRSSTKLPYMNHVWHSGDLILRAYEHIAKTDGRGFMGVLRGTSLEGRMLDYDNVQDSFVMLASAIQHDVWEQKIKNRSRKLGRKATKEDLVRLRHEVVTEYKNNAEQVIDAARERAGGRGNKSVLRSVYNRIGFVTHRLTGSKEDELFRLSPDSSETRKVYEKYVKSIFADIIRSENKFATNLDRVIAGIVKLGDRSANNDFFPDDIYVGRAANIYGLEFLEKLSKKKNAASALATIEEIHSSQEYSIASAAEVAKSFYRSGLVITYFGNHMDERPISNNHVNLVGDVCFYLSAGDMLDAAKRQMVYRQIKGNLDSEYVSSVKNAAEKLSRMPEGRRIFTSDEPIDHQALGLGPEEAKWMGQFFDNVGAVQTMPGAAQEKALNPRNMYVIAATVGYIMERVRDRDTASGDGHFAPDGIVNVVSTNGGQQSADS